MYPGRSSFVQNLLVIIFVSLFLTCEESPIQEIEALNNLPVVTNISVLNVIVFNRELSYDRPYTYRVTAEDSDESDTLSYTWVFTSRQYDPFVWSAHHDTLFNAGDQVEYTARSTHDFTVSCIVTDSQGGRSVYSEDYSVKTPADLADTSWKLDAFILTDSLPEILVEEDLILHFDSSPYYSLLGNCENRFGSLSIYNDTLSFDETLSEVYPDTCSDSFSLFIVGFMWLSRYQYEIHMDTLKFYTPGDSSQEIFARMLRQE